MYLSKGEAQYCTQFWTPQYKKRQQSLGKSPAEGHRDKGPEASLL